MVTLTIAGTAPTLASVAKTFAFEAPTTDSASKPMDFVALTIEPAAQTKGRDRKDGCLRLEDD